MHAIRSRQRSPRTVLRPLCGRQYPNPMVQNLPAKIGKYEVLEVLGEGGMGKVYKGVDPLIGRLVAIKVIVAAYIDNPELLKRFYREAKAVGNLQHPNIVTVYDLGEENKNPYLVMQYLDGEPLNKLIAARRELPLLQKLRIVAQVCDALAYAHQRDIVHRDVKPANVILLKDGQVKLLDFGIARLGTSGNSLTETKKGQVMGTMSYIAPEILNEEIADGRSDVYSTGVMLYELLTYRLPFESTELGSLIAKKMQGGPPPSLSKYLENYPPELDEIVSRAMARDREERYSTAQDFAFDLERLMERLKRDLVSHYVERARACISSAELGQAKEILSEVLKIDTQHTAAKQLLYEVQQSLQQQQRNERIRQQAKDAKVQEFLDAARREIAARKFEAALEYIHQAEELDPHRNDISALKRIVLAGQEQETRKRQLQQLCSAIQQELEANNLRIARDLADKALRAYPGEPALVRMKGIVESQIEAEERRQYIEDQILLASKSLEKGEANRALSIMQKAVHQFPTDTRLRDFLQVVRQVVQQDPLKRDRFDLPPRPDSEVNAAAATVMFNPTAAGANLTPVAGPLVSPEGLDPGSSQAPRSQVPAGSSEGSSATVLFEGFAVEPAAAADQLLPEPPQRDMRSAPTPGSGVSPKSGVGRSGSKSQPPASMNLPVEEVTKRLTTYLGPIAKILVPRLAAKSEDADQLYALAAERIPSEADRRNFLLSRKK